MKSTALTIGLYLNAVVMAGGTIAWLTRPAGPSFLPAAMASETPQIAGGSGVYLMPGQIAPNTWGVYLMDIDAQTLMVYQYTPGDHQLGLKAARSYRYDRRMQNFNSGSPTPTEVKELLDREQQPGRTPPTGTMPPGTPGSSGSAPASDNK